MVRLACLLLLGLAVTAIVQAQDVDSARRKAQEVETTNKLTAVRAQIKALVEQQRAATDQRDVALRDLREQELAIAAIARELHALDEQLADQQERLAALGDQHASLLTQLSARKQDLAALLRSAYALGQHEELKLLLQQDDVAAVARVLAYHRYFQRARIAQLDEVREEMKKLLALEDAIRAQSAQFESTRQARAAESASLERERVQREALVGELDARLKAQGRNLAGLGRDEDELVKLLERLHDVFADIPQQIKGAEAFASQRGRLRWPLAGRIVSAFGAPGEGGRPSSGLLLAAKVGTPVAAVARGRVAFADWLRGYGMVIILDHGDGYLSLYGCNESLLKEVGDWVDAGDTIATSGASGGQRSAGLYFELRSDGKPVDPRRWLR
ncbi:peptidoglycan DD-metalloendopeptidase family protein [Dokdonella sp.]|uniref:murein hydrolase activator EnvC family protein n=1 Tax=Dokdonella sp. TaxID=2291710 RepID=UPI0025B7B582|nr:peptidoglycan DD-metalloendopeptidase family protein [Dokdonella sp.]MBX3689756.1 peptidoglycan DD-metalloendopeptidase family protein [Dokdonella sp.]